MADENIGNAYVTVKPKVDNSFGKEIEEKAKPAGTGFGQKFTSGAKGAISAGAVAMGNILASAVQAVASNVGQVFADMLQGAMDYEQLAGGVEKIFDQADISGILKDANNAYKDLNMSANEYLAAINQTGAAFAQTMGDQKGYDTARTGMKAIADYASGTGRSIDELNDKFSLITRSTSSYQSIADQFSGILPATSKDFLEQAQAAGFLSDSYKSLTEVPIAEYQEAVSKMLEKGVADMGLAGNTALESAETMSGSLAMMKSSWENLLAGILNADMDVGQLFMNFVDSVGAVVGNFAPRIATLFTRIFEEVPQAIANTMSKLGLPAIQSFMDAFKPLTDAFGEFASGNGEIFNAMMERIGGHLEDLQPAMQYLNSAIGDLASALEPVVSALAPILLEIIANIMSALVGLLPIIVNIVAFVIDGISGIIEFITNLVTIIADLPAQVSDFFTQVNETGQAALDALGAAVSGAFTFIQGIIGTVVGAVTGFITGFGTAASNVFTSIQNVASTVVSSISSFFSGLANTLASIANSIYTSITGAFNNIVDTIRSIPERIVGFFRGLGDKITSAIGSIHFPQPSISFENVEVGPTSIPIPRITWHKLGGFVDGATLIGAGEAGPEMILPKSGGLMNEFADAVASRDDDEQLIRWLRANLGPIIADYAPTLSRRDFDRMARGAVT